MTLAITVGTRYAEAVLLRTKQRNVPVVVVEGATDSRAYRRVLDSSVHLVWMNGKDDVLALLQRFNDTKIAGSVGIVDADFGRLFGRNKESDRICWTSLNDLESMILSSNAYLRATPNRVDEETRRLHRELLVSAAFSLGCLRAESARSSLALDFKPLVFGAFIDRARVTCDDRACCEEVLRNNLQSELAVTDLMRILDETRRLAPNPWSMVNGHDLGRIAQLCSLRIFRREISSADGVFDALVKKYTVADFESCSTYEELLVWETANAGFKVTIGRTAADSLPGDSPTQN